MSKPDPSTVAPKRLLIRLSSLGDVILAASALEVYKSRGEQVDWVVAREYADLFENHPVIRRLWIFDRRQGFSGWVQLCHQLWQEDYREIYDLHLTLRTRLMRLLFFYWGAHSQGEKPQWRQISKQRFRLYGLFVFKGLWPKIFHPTPVAERAARVCLGTGSEHADFASLSRLNLSTPSLKTIRESAEPYYCVMPSGKWAGKKWPTRYFAELIRKTPGKAVVLGTPQDRESVALLEALKGSPQVVSAVGHYKLPEVAAILAGASFYLGNDTGLGHLAESVGVPAKTIMGPTTAQMGFAPWREKSRVFHSQIWCSPCGKDGRNCFRFNNRFKCMNDLRPDRVLQELNESLNGRPPRVERS